MLNMGYNTAKDLFYDGKGYETERLRIFCVTKTLVSWNLAKVASVCRERCGGGSFLMGTMIPEGIFTSHSAMTAEGDNSVLMQKIVKDILTDMKTDKHVMPKLTQCPKRQIPNLPSVNTLETLTNLIYYRE